MPEWLDKLLKRKSPEEQASVLQEDLDLEAFFTDVEHLCQLFRDLAAAKTLPKRILIIHGVGGVGKSTLLRMYRLYCKRQRMPVALVSGDEVKSSVDVLRGFAQDFTQDGIELPDLSQTLKRYCEIRAKVKQEGAEISGAMAKAGAKTAVEMAAGYIPVVGPVVAAFGGAGAEAFVDWLRGFLPESDLDLYLDPATRLAEDFLGDLALVANNRRLVLMLDTYEQMIGLDEWVRGLVRQLPANVLIIIAGRQTPGNTWDRDWPGWMAHAQIEAMETMLDDDVRALVHRYSVSQVGHEPDPAQMEEIVHFARGLPLVVTSTVRLWIRYGMKDFRALKPYVVADLVDRLMEGTPDNMRPVFEVAAVLRWLNRDILRELLLTDEIDRIYEELRRFPFIRSQAEGLVLHDVMRQMLHENLRAHDPKRYQELHQRAAAYFGTHLKAVADVSAEQLGRERLYHNICADEEAGMRLFQEAAEELARYRLVNDLRALLSDQTAYPLVRDTSRSWLEYYNARLLHLEGRLVEAECVYRKIAEGQQTEPKLQAYALCDLGQLWSSDERLGQPQGAERAREFLERGLQTAPQIDSKVVFAFSHLREVYTFQGEREKGTELLHRQLRFFQENGNEYGIVYTLAALRGAYGALGYWRKAYDAVATGLEVIRSMPENPFLKERLLAATPWVSIWSGRYAEVEQPVREGLTLLRQAGDDLQADLAKDLGFVLGVQGKYSEASSYFTESLNKYEYLGGEFLGRSGRVLGFWGAILIKQGDLRKADTCLGKSLSIKREIRDIRGIPEVSNWLGELHEVKAKQLAAAARSNALSIAESCYRESLDLRKIKRYYFDCGALTGLMRVKHTQDAFKCIPSILGEAELLAQQYEYNDHLASMRLTQGHVAWDGSLPNWGAGFDAALTQYQQAMIYALRFNRFLLDEVLWGGGVCTPLDPIIPHCQEHGDEGRQMLQALRDWWQTGVNDVGTPRPDSISPIPEGIPLLEAERLAREREPGDGLPQQTVTEKLDAALAEMA